MKITRDSFGHFHVEVTIEEVCKLNREFKLSPELCKMIDENRKAIVDEAMKMHRARKK